MNCAPFLSLVVDNFGVKYKYKDDASIKTMYTVTKDWSGDLYCGIPLTWDYVNRTVDISMPGSRKNYKNIDRFNQNYPDVSVLAGTKAIRNGSTSSPSNRRLPPS
jgi:hypothetical protein